MMKRFVFTAMALAGVAVATPAAAQGSCNRELLEGIAGDWVSAVEKGSGFELQLGEWVDFQANLEIGFMGEFLDKPRQVDWHRALLDTTSCKVMVESVILDEAEPMVLSTVLTNGFFGVSPISNIVTKQGDWQFDAAATAQHARAEDWAPIPEGQRDSRDELLAVANAYLDRLGDSSVQVPWAASCVRIDGGTQVASCETGLPGNLPAADRQFTVDEVLGAVNVQLRLGEQRRAGSVTLRIEDGKVRYVHTIANCGGDADCGLPQAS